MEYRRREIGAGLFIVISIGFLLAMVLLSSNIQDLFREKKEFQVLFTYAEGAEKNTPVKQAGIRVGKVTKIRVNKERGSRIELTLRVNNDTVVKRNSKVSIKSPLFGLTERYVEVTTGTPDSPDLMEGDILEGKIGIRIDEVTNTIIGVVEDMKFIVADIRKVVEDPEFTKNIKNAVDNLEEASAQIQDIVAKNRGKIDTSFGDMQKTTRDLKKTVANLNKLSRDLNLMAAENRVDLHNLVQNFRDTPEQIVKEVEAIRKSVTTPLDENQEDIQKIIENLEKITQNLREFTEEIKKKPWKLIRK